MDDIVSLRSKSIVIHSTVIPHRRQNMVRGVLGQCTLINVELIHYSLSFGRFTLHRLLIVRDRAKFHAEVSSTIGLTVATGILQLSQIVGYHR